MSCGTGARKKIPASKNIWIPGKGIRGLSPQTPRRRPIAGESFTIPASGATGPWQILLRFFNRTRQRDARYTCLFQREIYTDDEYWLEVMPKHATKAEGIHRLKELCGYDRIVSFGDALNDIPMFRGSDEAYAVENAVPALKAAASGIIGSNEEDGVANWLLENCLI